MKSTWEELMEYAEQLGFTIEEIKEVIENLEK